MPKRADIKSVFVIGAGPIVIGQACEFDYSGTQACRALREEGVRVALLNSNPATIMTDPNLADATYIEPIDADTAAEIIKKEKVDAVLPTMGGQTALNCAMQLHERGVFGAGRAIDGKPALIGAGVKSIHKAEDRKAFRRAMGNIGLRCAPSQVVADIPSAMAALDEVGFPVIVRPSYTLGGSGGGIAYNKEAFYALIARALDESPNKTALMERSLIGWKEFEMEVVRDKRDNCIIVCAIENLDPMGVHTGDSITVAPAQTLTDKEYQLMRDAAIAVVREIGVDTGGANVQFAVNPQNGDMVVIEMNPRVSRSSALASKATGFPIAKVATKLALGYTLDEIKNDITGGAMPASFEPSLDYVVVKIPRFDFGKFAPTPDALTTQMQSVGEVMAIGGAFNEALQKALRGLEAGHDGLNSDGGFANIAARAAANAAPPPAEETQRLAANVARPHSRRLLAVADAMRAGICVEEIHKLSRIDPWFLQEIAALTAAEKEMLAAFAAGLKKLPPATMRAWKRLGFSDRFMGFLLDAARGKKAGGAEAVLAYRRQHKIAPVFKRIDTCAGEFPTETAYFYSTYHGDECELRPSPSKKKILILGSGPNRIGQGIEFDYCCVHGIMALKEEGFETLMLNCNPETVSTDYDTADRLFFEPLTVEDVMEVIRRENPAGVITQFGGQTPLGLAHGIQRAGAPIIGTSVEAIDRAESREQFKRLLKQCKLRQPQNAIVGGGGAKARAKALQAAAKIGYPLIARPSYVLGGKQMAVAHNEAELRAYFDAHPQALQGDLLLDGFLQEATEVDVDAVRDARGDCLVAGVMEHIEHAGVHSGDSACSLPPYTLSAKITAQLQEQARRLANALQVVGLMNAQFAIVKDEIYVLEVNPRASRTAPFVSKATGLPLAKIAAKTMAGIPLRKQGVPLRAPTPPYFSVKEAVFPFGKFPNMDILLGPEMKSTGEAMGMAEDFHMAFLLAQKTSLPVAKLLNRAPVAAFSVRDQDKPAARKIARELARLGYAIGATENTAKHFCQHGIPAQTLKKVAEGKPHIVDEIISGKVQFLVNTVDANAQARADSFDIRRAALANKMIYSTTLSGAQAAARALARAQRGGFPAVRALQQWHKRIAAPAAAKPARRRKTGEAKP